MEINELTGLIVSLCIKIHTKIGPGCFENVYEEILCYELQKLNIEFKRQFILPIDYEDLHVPRAYKLDLLIENKLILELKSIFPLPPVYFKQIKTHLSLLNLRHGMLLNFKTEKMKDGIFRIYNNFTDSE